jgi:hypothetical protein
MRELVIRTDGLNMIELGCSVRANRTTRVSARGERRMSVSKRYARGHGDTLERRGSSRARIEVDALDHDELARSLRPDPRVTAP